MAQLVTHRLNYPMGPGFESQVPQNFVMFFLQVLRCSIPSVDYHMSSDLNVPSGFKLDPKARIIDPPWIQVNACIGDWKSQQGPTFWAWNYADHTPNSSPTPPKVCLYFYFFSLIFYCFLLLLLKTN